jgi:hypothetical protein
VDAGEIVGSNILFTFDPKAGLNMGCTGKNAGVLGSGKKAPKSYLALPFEHLYSKCQSSE